MVAKFYLQGSVAVLIPTLIALFSTTVLIEVVKEYIVAQCYMSRFFSLMKCQGTQLFLTKLYHSGLKVEKNLTQTGKKKQWSLIVFMALLYFVGGW